MTLLWIYQMIYLVEKTLMILQFGPMANLALIEEYIIKRLYMEIMLL